MFPLDIKKEEIREFPLLKFKGKIHLLDSIKKVREAAKVLNQQTILGFDTEKKPTFRKGQYHPTALVQLSTAREAFLFRINSHSVSRELLSILENPQIMKIGISLKDDIIELNKVSKFEAANFMDINDIAADMGIQREGVRNLTAIFLKKRISKSQQTSNWENANLTEAQMNYAATDAWICLHIYELLLNKGYLENGTT